MGHVILNTGACTEAEVVVTERAAKKVRMAFNPSGIERVDRIKSLAAALVSELSDVERECNDGGNVMGISEAVRAIEHTQLASMLGVAAATSHL